MKHNSHQRLSKKTVFVYRSRDQKKGMSTDPTETSITIIVTGTGVNPGAQLSPKKS